MQPTSTAALPGQDLHSRIPRHVPRAAARVLTALLWLAGVVYMTKAELARPHPDWIDIAVVALVWAAVIALPVIASHALDERKWIAAALLTLSAVAGTAWTLSGTLARNAETRDVKVADARAIAERRGIVQAQLDEAERMLAASRASHARECATGKGRNCTGLETVIRLSDEAASSLRNQIDRMQIAAPEAGEQRIAALIAFTRGGTAEEWLPVVGGVLPALLGILLDLAALACAMYAFHSRSGPQAGYACPSLRSGPQAAYASARSGLARLSAKQSDLAGQSGYPAISDAEAARMLAFLTGDQPGPSGGSSGNHHGPRRPRDPQPDGRKSEVLAALLTDLGLGRSAMSQRDLCERFGVPRSTMSDWLGEWERAGLIPARRTVGRCKVLVE